MRCGGGQEHSDFRLELIQQGAFFLASSIPDLKTLDWLDYLLIVNCAEGMGEERHRQYGRIWTASVVEQKDMDDTLFHLLPDSASDFIGAVETVLDNEMAMIKHLISADRFNSFVADAVHVLPLLLFLLLLCFVVPFHSTLQFCSDCFLFCLS